MADLATGVRLVVEPQRGPADEPWSVRVVGLAGGVSVVLRASTTDDLGAVWSSVAELVADADGTVDVARDQPITGSYAGIDPTGLLWSMEPARSDALPFRGWSSAPRRVVVTAEVAGDTVARVDAERRYAADGVTSRSLDRDGLVGASYWPPGAGPVPAVLLIGGTNGAVAEGMAALLASRGIAAVALRYFGGDGLPESLVEIPLEYFDQALAWLRRQGRVSGVGLVGTSKGAEAALLVAARHDDVEAVVAYCPSSHVFMGISRDMSQPPRSAWTSAGEPVEFLSAVAPRFEGAGPFETTPAYVAAIEQGDPDRVNAAAIAVEDIRGHVLVVSGRHDGVWPATRFGVEIVQRIEAVGRSSARHLVYDEAGHALHAPYVPTTQLVSRRGPVPFTTGGTAAGNAFALADSWPHVVRHLQRIGGR